MRINYNCISYKYVSNNQPKKKKIMHFVIYVRANFSQYSSTTFDRAPNDYKFKARMQWKKKKMLYHVESNDQYSQRNYPSSVYADLVPIRNFVSFALEKVDKSGLQNQRCAVCRCTN